jgi:predicted nucleic acid-binding protein
MPLYLFDTNALSDLVDGQPNLVTRFQAHQGQVLINAVVLGEVRHGLARMPAGKRRTQLVAATNAVLATLPCVPITDRVAELYGPLKDDLERRGLPLENNDLWIAASALDLGAVLVSRDGDFRYVPKLQVEDWTP